jgi:CheY-like chemotaxis protein
VLLAEDNLVNVLVAREMIQSFGCEVHVVDDGMQAITQATQNRYDLIFMDVQMPVCDGLEATRMIRKSESLEGRSPILIYALTANAMAEEREECLNAGMDGVVAKPFSPDDIRRVLAIVSARASVTA